MNEFRAETPEEDNLCQLHFIYVVDKLKLRLETTHLYANLKLTSCKDCSREQSVACDNPLQGPRLTSAKS